MSVLQEMIKLIPRGRLSEWGGGGRASDRSSDNGYLDDEDMQFVNRRKGKKVVKNVVVKEAEKLEFHATGDADKDVNSVWVLVMSNHPDDDRYDDYHGVNVIFHRNGKVTAATADKVADAEWKEYKHEIIEAAENELDKHPKLRKHLSKTYGGDLSGED